jgi:hypothetical protein
MSNMYYYLIFLWLDNCQVLTGTISCNSSLYTNKEILKGYNNWVKYIINGIGWSIDEKDYEIFWFLIFTSQNTEMLPQKKCQKKEGLSHQKTRKK